MIGTGHDNKIAAIIALAAMVAAVIIYGLWDPASQPFPRCPIKVMTGLDCPGCGSQRAIHALLNGDFTGAWHYNAFMVIIIPVATAAIISEAIPRRFTTLRRIILSPATIMTIIAATVLWTVGRNIL